MNLFIFAKFNLHYQSVDSFRHIFIYVDSLSYFIYSVIIQIICYVLLCYCIAYSLLYFIVLLHILCYILLCYCSADSLLYFIVLLQCRFFAMFYCTFIVQILYIFIRLLIKAFRKLPLVSVLSVDFNCSSSTSWQSS